MMTLVELEEFWAGVRTGDLEGHDHTAQICSGCTQAMIGNPEVALAMFFYRRELGIDESRWDAFELLCRAQASALAGDGWLEVTFTTEDGVGVWTAQL
jgi:hypothetical protein